MITEADGQQVGDAEDLVRALGAKEEGEVALTVVRDKQRRTVRVTPERRQTPRGLLGPGAFGVISSPVAEVTLPRVVIDALPEITIPVVAAPRLRAMPRVRVTPPRITVYAPGDRIL